MFWSTFGIGILIMLVVVIVSVFLTACATYFQEGYHLEKDSFKDKVKDFLYEEDLETFIGHCILTMLVIIAFLIFSFLLGLLFTMPL